MLSRLHRRAEALDQACLRSQGHPGDYAIRQELLSALEWDVSLHPEHARPAIRDMFEQVRAYSTDLLRRLQSSAEEPKSSAPPIAEVHTLRQWLAKLLEVLATRHETANTTHPQRSTSATKS